MKENKSSRKIIEQALAEDIGSGDITTDSIVSEYSFGQARIISKQNGILSGIYICEHVFKTVDENLEIKIDHKDGDSLQSGETVMVINGKTGSILKAERVALNFLAHLSGVATFTNRFVNKLGTTKTKIIDTRKTTPLLRVLEKEAVVHGGGANHRMGLYDMVLIKENHIRAAGGIRRAVEQTNRFLSEMKIDAKIEVETTNLDEVHEALTCEIDRIMLDNMTIDQMKEAVGLINHQVEVEASGGIGLEQVNDIASTGVDFISVGAITHSAPAFDFSLLLEEK